MISIGRARALGAALLVSLLGGCPGAFSQPFSQEGAPRDQSTVLRVGTSGDYPPFSRSGEGFDIDVARAFAAELGLAVEWVPFRWTELGTAVGSDAFDIAMSGVTWRPERGVVGFLSRAVASGGPCVVGAAAPQRVAVNRGGILERYARERFTQADILATDDNLSLPSLLEQGKVDAFVTDSFEVWHFRRPGNGVVCEPLQDRKVYWVAPARAADLGARLDTWLDRSEPLLDDLRRRHFGGSAPRDDLDHLVDLLSRRLAFMPYAAAWKRARSLPLRDPEQEARVLARSRATAERAGLDAASAADLFAVQIELATAVQERAAETPATLDLEHAIRPALERLGERIVAALVEVVPVDAEALSPDRLEPLKSYLTDPEIQRLRQSLLGVRAQ